MLHLVSHQLKVFSGIVLYAYHCAKDRSDTCRCCCCCCFCVASVMSDSVRPHRRQPTRLPHPWDSPGKNTEVGCHSLLQCMKVKSESEVTHSFRVRPLATPWTAAFQAPPSMGFSRQEYWSGVPLPSPGLFSSHPISPPCRKAHLSLTKSGPSLISHSFPSQRLQGSSNAHCL